MIEFKGMGETKDKFFNYLDSIMPRSRNTDPETSHQAADQVNFSAKHIMTILECLKTFGPMGKDGIAAHTSLDGSQVCRRLAEMQKVGLVRLTGHTVKSKANRAEREWEIA